MAWRIVSDGTGGIGKLYYKDLTKYCYCGKRENSYNIGWIERGHIISKGEVPQEFINKIWKYLRYPVNVYRGFHTCTLCMRPSPGVPIVEYNGEQRDVGYYEMRIWARDGKVYAAPSLIFHYISCHGYKPPQEFIDAVLEAEEPDSDEYYRKVLEYWEGYDFWIEEDRTKRE